MAFSRASAIRGAFQAFRPLSTSVGKPQSWRQVGRRGYASHGHETKQASSDIPWAIGAFAVTAPSVYYLLQSGSENAHGHGDGHGGHGKDHGDDEHEVKAKDGEESEDGDKDSEKSDDSGSDGEGVGTSKGDNSDVKDKTDNTKNESNDEVPSSKPAGNQKDQAEKQENLSNADHKHSTDIEGNSGTSKKGEGIPETAKSKGSVDPKRPQNTACFGGTMSKIFKQYLCSKLTLEVIFDPVYHSLIIPMDLGSSQHSGAISNCFIGGSSHSYPYMPEIGDSSVKKDPKKPRVSSRNSRAENSSRDGSTLPAFGPPDNRPSESNFSSLRKHTTVGNFPSRGGSPSQRARRHQWINPFCREPEDDLQTCCLGCWLPCSLYGKTQHRLFQISEGLDPLDEAGYKPCDGACWGFACVELWFGSSCVFATLDRTRIRAMYNIQGTIAGDVLTTMFCTRCALMQHDREIRAREQLAAANGEKPTRGGTVYDQPSRHSDLVYATSLSPGPSSAGTIPHRSGLIRETPTEANVEIMAEKFATEKNKEYPKSNSGSNKLRKYPKIHSPGEDCSKKAKDSTNPKSPKSSNAGGKTVKNLSPLGSALNPITRFTKIDPSEKSGIISLRQPWRGHGMTIKPASKPKRDPDQKIDNLTLETSRKLVADRFREDSGGNENMDETLGRRVVFKGSEDHSAGVENDNRFQKEAVVSPSQRRSSLAASRARVSEPKKDSTADESVLVYYSDGEVPQRHRLRDCARLRASTISHPKTHRENRVLGGCVSDDVTSSRKQSEVGTSKIMNASVGGTEEHQNISNAKGDSCAHNGKRVEASTPGEKRLWVVSQHSLNDCVVEHVEPTAGPRPIQPILQHSLADCVQAECEVENTNAINVSQHNIADCATNKDIDPTRGSSGDAVTVFGDSHGGALREERSGSRSTEISPDEPAAVVATASNAGVTDASPQADRSFQAKSPEVIITSTVPVLSDEAKPRSPDGHHSATVDSQTERKPSETPTEAALALRREMCEPTPLEPSLSNLVDGTTDTLDHMPICKSRSRVARENGKRRALY